MRGLSFVMMVMFAFVGGKRNSVACVVGVRDFE